MTQSLRRLRRTAVSLSLAAALFMPQLALADAAHVSPLRLPAAVKAAAPTKKISFDWQGPRPGGSQENVTRQTRLASVLLGRGSWVCSPAGFGKRSRCYSR